MPSTAPVAPVKVTMILFLLGDGAAVTSRLLLPFCNEADSTI